VDSPAHILARFDRIPVWPWPRRILWVVGFGFFFSFFDVVTIGFALPVISKDFKVSADTASWAITSGLLGYIIGSFLDSRIADRFGRRVALFLSVSFFSIGSLLTATSPGLGWLIFWRVISGMGIGGEIASVTTYLGELSPAKLRGRCTAWAIAAGFLGFAMVPFVALALVPQFSWGWRALFVVGGVGGVLVFLMRRNLPQPIHWLLVRGKVKEADGLTREAEIRAEKKIGRPLPSVGAVEEVGTQISPSFRHLFRPPYLRRLIQFALVWFFYYIGNYAWLTLAPDLLEKIGISLKNSIAFLSVTGLGFVVGAVGAALISDRFERKLSTMLILLLWATSLILIGVFPSKVMIMVLGFTASLTIGLLVPILYTYTAENFHTAFRATGVSVTDGLGHLGGAFCGQIIFAVYRPFGFFGAFLTMAVTGIMAAILLSLGIRATGRSLHEL